MRQIKFRAWQIKRKKMMQVDELNGLDKWSKEGMIGCNSLNVTIGIQGGEHNDCILMQYTIHASRHTKSGFNSEKRYNETNRRSYGYDVQIKEGWAKLWLHLKENNLL